MLEVGWRGWGTRNAQGTRGRRRPYRWWPRHPEDGSHHVRNGEKPETAAADGDRRNQRNQRDHGIRPGPDGCDPRRAGTAHGSRRRGSPRNRTRRSGPWHNKPRQNVPRRNGPRQNGPRRNGPR